MRGQSSGQTRNFYHDEDGTLLTDIDTTSNTVTHYIRAGSRQVAAGSAGKGYVFHHFDKTGNTLALTDTTGQVVGAYSYDAYGKVVARSGSVTTAFTYVGAYGVMEGAENLFFMRNRYYDAITGRFIQRDPVGIIGSQSNLYGYVRNSPIVRVDPIGLWDTGDTLGILGGLGGASAVAFIFTGPVGAGTVLVLTILGGTVTGTTAHTAYDYATGRIGSENGQVTWGESVCEGASLGMFGSLFPAAWAHGAALGAADAAMAAPAAALDMLTAKIMSGNTAAVIGWLSAASKLPGGDKLLRAMNQLLMFFVSRPEYVNTLDNRELSAVNELLRLIPAYIAKQ